MVGIAGLLEIVWAVLLKQSEGFSKLWPSVGFVVAGAGSIVLLALALRDLPVSTAYAAWTGIGAVGTAIAGLSPAAREELSSLFALLAFAPVRVAFANVDSSWGETSVTTANAFLIRLQKSRWSVKRTAYDALHQLAFAAWYANPRTWPAIGYPGPPALS